MGNRALPVEAQEVSDEELQDAARHVLGYYDLPGGYPPGGFATSLIATYEKADPSNRVRLAFAFPAIVRALGYVQRNEVEALSKLASGRN